MKKIFRYIVFFAAALALAPAGFAATDGDGTIVTKKNISGPDNRGVYTLTLESYVTSYEVTTQESQPADIVLVLDYSGSMDDENVSETRTLTIDDYNFCHWDISYNNRVVQVVDGELGYYTGGGVMGGPRVWHSLGTSFEGTFVFNKQDALKLAVRDFIVEIDKNDRINPVTKQLRDKRLGNKISIITFAGQNEAQVRRQLTLLGNSALAINDYTGYNNLLTLVKGLNSPNNGTYVEKGMALAEDIITNPDNQYHSTAPIKTVVLFTDGIPGNGNWSNASATTSANAAIESANNIKGSDGTQATVWSVGIFGNMSESNKALTDTYMNRVSSNYLGVENMTDAATAVSDKYYFEASPENSLSDIFKTISQHSGGTVADVGSSARVLDVVTQSFQLPDIQGATYTVNVYEVPADHSHAMIGDGKTDVPFVDELDGYNKNDYASSLTAQTVVNADNTTSVTVTGFNYAENWCGWDDTDPSNVGYRGKKLVIEIPIQINPDAIGGINVDTNGASSGLYAPKKDENGNIITDANGNPVYEVVGSYDPSPALNIPVTLKIVKNGLRAGENASFDISRALIVTEEYTASDGSIKVRPKVVNGKIQTTGGYQYYMTVFVEDTNPKATLRGLSPDYLYEIKENKWSWTYQYQANNVVYTEGVETNPFVFTNEPEDPDIKHAEAKVRNVFTKKTEVVTNPTN